MAPEEKFRRSIRLLRSPHPLLYLSHSDHQTAAALTATSPATAAAAAPFHHHNNHHHHQAVPIYGYSPTYITAADMNYNHKVGFTGGSYMNGHFGQVYPAGQTMVGAGALMPMYPYYHFHQSQSMGLPAHLYCPTAAGPIPTVPALISKPTSIAPPNAVCLAVE